MRCITKASRFWRSRRYGATSMTWQNPITASLWASPSEASHISNDLSSIEHSYLWPYEYPKNRSVYKKVKTWASVLSLIPCSGLRIASPKDKQRSQPTSRLYYAIRNSLYEEASRMCIIYPTWTFRCRIFLGFSKLRSLNTEENVRKRPFIINRQCPPLRAGCLWQR